MTFEAHSKFSLGDLVRVNRYHKVEGERLPCPICKGNYEVKDPRYGLSKCEDDYDEYITCMNCVDGFIAGVPKIELRLSETIYRVDSVIITVSNNQVEYKYRISTIPEYNSINLYSSETQPEDRLVAVEPGDLK